MGHAVERFEHADGGIVEGTAGNVADCQDDMAKIAEGTSGAKVDQQKGHAMEKREGATAGASGANGKIAEVGKGPEFLAVIAIVTQEKVAAGATAKLLGAGGESGIGRKGELATEGVVQSIDGKQGTKGGKGKVFTKGLPRTIRLDSGHGVTEARG